jgi:outer membrane protein TolC
VHGLATQPEYLLAVQDQAKAGYELQTAHGSVMEQQAALAEHLGIAPDLPLKTVTIDELNLPEDLEKSADLIIDEALEQRPDLAAKVAEIRAKDAEIRKAEATYWPTVNLGFQAGWKIWDYANASNAPQTAGAPNVKIETPLAAAYVQMSWNIFEGFSGVNAINKAEANRNAAQAEFDALQLKVMREVWKNYADFKIAIRKRQFALAMLKASEKTYEAATASFQQGLVTVIELITAERNLAAARYTEIDSKRAILDSAASLVFSAGSQEDQQKIAFDQSTNSQHAP